MMKHSWQSIRNTAYFKILAKMSGYKDNTNYVTTCTSKLFFLITSLLAFLYFRRENSNFWLVAVPMAMCTSVYGLWSALFDVNLSHVGIGEVFIHHLKGLAQAKIIKKSVILFRFLNMTI